jgi:type 1 fimbriae regulatory protein FimB
MNSTKPANNLRRQRAHKHLTEHEIDKLLAAAKDETVTRNSIRNYVMLLMTFRHGLRVSELCGLKVSDVDFQEGKEGTITIRRLKHGVSGIHPLFKGEAKALKAWLAIRADTDSDALFVSEQGKPFTRAAINLLLDRIARAANLKNVNPHALRHAAGYHAVNTGTDIRVIQRYLGHKSIASTVIYTEVDHAQFNKLF